MPPYNGFAPISRGEVIISFFPLLLPYSKPILDHRAKLERVEQSDNTRGAINKSLAEAISQGREWNSRLKSESEAHKRVASERSERLKANAIKMRISAMR